MARSSTCDKIEIPRIIGTHPLIPLRDFNPSFPMHGGIAILITHGHKLPLANDEFLFVGGTCTNRTRPRKVSSGIFHNITVRSL